MNLKGRLPDWIKKFLIPSNDQNYIEFQKPIRLSDPAKVRERIKLNPGSVKVPSSKAASYVDHGINGAWEFSDGTDDTIVGVFEQPTNIDSAIEIHVLWSSAVTSGDCVWQLEYLYTGLGNDTTGSAQETLTSTDSVNGTANVMVETTFTGIANPSNNDRNLTFRLKRLGANASDTISDTVELVGMTYEYVSDRLGSDNITT